MLSSSITQSVNSAQTISPIKLNVRRPALLPPPSPIFAEFLKRARNLEPVNRPVGAHLQAFSTARTVQSNPPAGLYRIPRGGADVGLRRGNEIRFDELIERTSANFGLPSSLVKAVVRAESGFDAKAVSPMGASGLMQLMPGTARSVSTTRSIPSRTSMRALSTSAGSSTDSVALRWLWPHITRDLTRLLNTAGFRHTGRPRTMFPECLSFSEKLRRTLNSRE